jgi:hypothetical protein
MDPHIIAAGLLPTPFTADEIVELRGGVPVPELVADELG